MLRYLRNPTLVLTLVLTLGLLGNGLAQTPAQDLRSTLPADSILVLGMQQLATVWDDLGDFRGEFERLEVGEALLRFFGDGTVDELGDELGLEGELDVLGLLGQDAWLSLSASPFSPMPAVTALARPDVGTMVTVARLIGERSARDGASPLSEGDYSFFVTDLDDPDSPFQVLAYGQAEGIVYLSTNPDTLRGVLRRLGGAAEPGLANNPDYEATLGSLDDGHLYGYLDYAAAGALARPLAAGMGLDRAVNRLGQALDTLGVSAGVARVTEEGLETESVQRVNPEGGDATLLGLLTEGSTPPEARALAPAEALSYSSSATDLRAWWDYLNELSRSVPELGGDLNSLIVSFIGIDLSERLFGWMGEGLATITTGFGDPTEPGVASANLLGDQVFAIPTTDAGAAETNLSELFNLVTTTLAAFADPMGQALPQAEGREIGGVDATFYAVSPGVTVAHAVTDGYALIATSAEALESVLTARAGGQTLEDRAEVTALLEGVPAEASSVSYVDNQANLAFTAGQMRSQLQLGAGLTGSADLDFEAVSAAGEAIESFLAFVATRLGPGVSYSLTSPEGSTSYSFTPVRW